MTTRKLRPFIYMIEKFVDPNDQSGIAVLHQGHCYYSFDYILDTVIPNYMEKNCPLFSTPFEWSGLKTLFFNKPHPSNIDIEIVKHYLWDLL